MSCLRAHFLLYAEIGALVVVTESFHHGHAPDVCLGDLHDVVENLKIAKMR
jgi:hypothetical protein